MSVSSVSSRKSEILRERARQLAREPDAERGEGEVIEVVTFQLAHERYAVESQRVREVCRIRELTPLPGTPPYLLGVLNFRGEIISVLDVKRFFDLPERGLTDRTLVVIVHAQGMDCGVLADVVFGLEEIRADALEPPLSTATGIRAEYVRGVTADRLILLDIAEIMTDTSRRLAESGHG